MDAIDRYTVRITKCFPNRDRSYYMAYGTINGVNFHADVDLDANDGDGVVKSLVTDFVPRPGFSRNMCNNIIDAVAVRMGHMV